MSDTFNMAAAARNLRAREEKRAQERRRLHARARAGAAAIIDMIIRRFNPVRVYQWGSLLDPDRFDENSDIDIAVEGIGGPEQFFSLYNTAAEMTSFPLDLVEIDKVDDLSRESILSKGKVCYERT